MPNWSEGSLRLRGKKENILKFLKRLERSDRDDWCYIPDTHRAFVIGEPYSIDDSIELVSECKNDSTVISLHICQAWGG